MLVLDTGIHCLDSMHTMDCLVKPDNDEDLDYSAFIRFGSLYLMSLLLSTFTRKNLIVCILPLDQAFDYSARAGREL